MTERRGSLWLRVGHSWLWLFVLALACRLPLLFLTGNHGTDAGARYNYALDWLEHPNQLPTDCWLPLHFWLLGVVLWVWESEFSARLLTALLGALTVLPFWGIMRRIFGERVGLSSALVFVFFGLHIAYSATTSAEAPLMFFVILGTYGWVRFRPGGGPGWLFLCGVAFGAASLLKFEAWLFIPTLGVLLLDFSQGWSSAWRNRRAWGRMVAFVLTSSAGIFGWMIFSFLKWGHPIASARFAFEIGRSLEYPHSLAYRVTAHPGGIAVTLTPVLAGLAALGAAKVLWRGKLLQRTPALLAIVLGGAWLYLAISTNTTMARYTLIYSWLLIPYAFVELERISQSWPWAQSRTTLVGLLLFFLLWQAGIIVGAHYGPPIIANKLSSVSPTLPYRPDIRDCARWLKEHRRPGEKVLLDDFNQESGDVAGLARIPRAERSLLLTESVMRPSDVERRVRDYLQHRPRFLVYSPSGQFAKIWSLDAREQQRLVELGVRLHRRWQGGNYRIYELQYSHDPGKPLESQSK